MYSFFKSCDHFPTFEEGFFCDGSSAGQIVYGFLAVFAAFTPGAMALLLKCGTNWLDTEQPSESPQIPYVPVMG